MDKSRLTPSYHNEEQGVDHLSNELAVQQIIQMLDLFSNTPFWIKDREGRFVYINQALIQKMGLKNADPVIGRSDIDFCPQHIAKQFIHDDKMVLAGEHITERLEMNLLSNGEIAWFSTSKRPLINQHGDVIGTYGLTRHIEKSVCAFGADKNLHRVINFISHNYMAELKLSDLCEMSHLSQSALERRFKKHLEMTPLQFINKVRLENSRRLLIESDLPIAMVAHTVGFTDHSYFSRQFKRMFGELPSALRIEVSEG